ncbi:PQQ-binding-like beta-propeller repeat protein [Actinoplanes sp. NPDC049596]|uniref:PQQ-binding-like beta-propeller repeat protein n=1 Tax=unclassified Actinoplanes TaxID=2626549 RepID=UPI003422F378
MKRHFAAAVVAVCVLAGQAPAAASAPDEWGQPAAHATGDYYNPGETRLTMAAAAKLRARWTVPLATAKCATPAVPLVAANRLITAGAYRISGFDATTGALVWQTPASTRKTSISLAAIVGTRLVAQSRDCRSGKTFLATYDVTTGRVLYSKRIPETMYGLLADRGIVAGSVWDATISKYGIRAYRIADGSRAWARPDASIGGETVAAGGKILVVADGKTTAVDLTTGKTVWPAGAGCYTPIGASPDGATFYMRCDPDGPIRSVDAATGAVRQTFPSPAGGTGFATDGERIYLHTFADELIAVDAKDGRRVWTTKFTRDAPIMFAVGGGVLYGWRDSTHPLAAVNARTGEVFRLGAQISGLAAAPMVANGRLYARTESTVTAYAP